MKQKNNWAGKNGPLLIAEVGGNHEGNFSYAKKLVKLAIQSGVDIVKLQLYTGPTLVSKVESRDRFKHFLQTIGIMFFISETISLLDKFLAVVANTRFIKLNFWIAGIHNATRTTLIHSLLHQIINDLSSLV